MEGISLGTAEDRFIESKNIFAILNFKHDDMTGYWPYTSKRNGTSYWLTGGIPTMRKEILLSAKCLIKW